MILYFELSPKCFIKVTGYNNDDIIYKLNVFFSADLSYLNCINKETFKKDKSFHNVLTLV